MTKDVNELLDWYAGIRADEDAAMRRAASKPKRLGSYDPDTEKLTLVQCEKCASQQDAREAALAECAKIADDVAERYMGNVYTERLLTAQVIRDKINDLRTTIKTATS